MTDSRVDPEALARYLRQRQEMGLDPIYLESLSRAEALASSRGGRGPIETSRRPGSDEKVEGKPTRSGEVPAARGGTEQAFARGARESGTGMSPNAAAAGGTDAAISLPVLTGDLEATRTEVMACTRCRLHSGRTQAVFADGNPNARLMVVGEAPGEQEDRTGLPFVGPAGKLLDLMLASIGLSRLESVYICNVIKCRPPGNRNPLPDEIETCAPYLRRQIELVKPEALLAVGTFSGKLLTRSDRPLGKLRGEVYSYEGVPLVITYHPAALLRNQGWSRLAWDDLQLLRQVMDG
jgi:uracil-DNA glycosylase family 4